jgi:dihydrofolate synthase/folylpolyglutamate synthase
VLKKFLDKKPLYYDEIDYTRMPRVYESIKNHFKLPKIIHLIGTNGKGTTGRFLASALYSLGYNVGHYTSPHILEFNERIWLNGKNVSDATLNKAHKELQNILTHKDSSSLSYFEYTTLIAMWIYKDFDYVVLEAGLGGEHDATAVFDNELTLVTPIDMDHEAFLGNSIKDIATTKLNAVKKRAILAHQKNEEVYEVAKTIANDKYLNIDLYDKFLDEQDYEKVKVISRKNSLAPYLQENLKLSIAGLKSLCIKYNVENFNNSKLFGRLTPLNENILVDVGHNPLAARSICESLKGEKYNLIYNSYKDKNYREILNILKPIILSVEIIKIDDERIESQDIMIEALNDLSLEYKEFEKIDINKKYLVFGSFSVVEAFLKVYGG